MQYFLKSFLSTLLLVTYIARWSAAYDAAGSSRKLSRLVRRPPFAVIRNPCESEPTTYRQWPRNIIQYKYSDTLDGTLKSSIQRAIETLEKSYCVQFVPRTNAQDYAVFEQGQNCCTHKGYLGNGAQKVYIDSSCTSDLLRLLAKLAGIMLNATSPTRASTSQNRCEGVCGHSLHLSAHSNGTIKSPGYPSMHYPPNSKCTWKLWMPANTFLELKFKHFDVEDDSECNYDYVRILEQNSTGTVTNEQHYCGSIPVTVINSTVHTTVITVEFFSDEDVERQGFHFQYLVHSPGIHHGGSLPNQNQCSINNGGCEHNCTESSGIKNCSCRSGFSLAPDGHTCRDLNECAIDKTLCHHRCKNTVGSFYCHCRPGFGLSSDGRNCVECGGYLNVTEGTITSPGFPSPYRPNQNCDWYIYIHAGHYLNVTLSKVDIIQSEKCQANHLRLQQSRFRYSRRLCGYYEIINYLVKQSEIYSRFRFITSNTNEAQGTGFKLHFNQVKIEQLTSRNLNFVRINRNKSIPYNSRVWN